MHRVGLAGSCAPFLSKVSSLRSNKVKGNSYCSPISADLVILCFFSQILDKREPGDRLPLAPEAHRAGRQVGATQEDRPQVRAAQRRLSVGHSPLSGETPFTKHPSRV